MELTNSAHIPKLIMRVSKRHLWVFRKKQKPEEIGLRFIWEILHIILGVVM